MNIGDTVRLEWQYDYDHGYGFAIIVSKTDKTAKACLVQTNTIEYVAETPITQRKVIIPGALTNAPIQLLLNGGVRFSRKVKEFVNIVDEKHTYVKWKLWNGQPITIVSSHD